MIMKHGIGLVAALVVALGCAVGTGGEGGGQGGKANTGGTSAASCKAPG